MPLRASTAFQAALFPEQYALHWRIADHSKTKPVGSHYFRGRPDTLSVHYPCGTGGGIRNHTCTFFENAASTKLGYTGIWYPWPAMIRH